MTARNEFIDYLKGLLIFLVVLGHVIQYAVFQNVGFWDDPVFKAIYMFHMPLFMGVSGYLLGHDGPRGASIRKIFRRVLSYLIPIFSWSILFQLIAWAMTGSDPTQIVPGIVGEITSGLWFLWALIGAIVLTSIAEAFGRIALIVSILTWVATLMVPDIGNSHLFKYVYPYFLIGYYAPQVHQRMLTGPWFKVVFAGVALGSALSFALWSHETYIYVSKMTMVTGNVHNILLRYLAGLVVSAFALVLAFYLYRASTPRLRMLLSGFGQRSLHIYIISGYLFVAVLWISKELFDGGGGGTIWTAFAIGVSSVVCTLCWWLGSIMSRSSLARVVLFGKFRWQQ